MDGRGGWKEEKREGKEEGGRKDGGGREKGREGVSEEIEE